MEEKGGVTSTFSFILSAYVGSMRVFMHYTYIIHSTYAYQV